MELEEDVPGKKFSEGREIVLEGMYLVMEEETMLAVKTTKDLWSLGENMPSSKLFGYANIF